MDQIYATATEIKQDIFIFYPYDTQIFDNLIAGNTRKSNLGNIGLKERIVFFLGDVHIHCYSYQYITLY